MRSMDQVEDVRGLIGRIWGQYAVVPPNFLRALGMAGSASLLVCRDSVPVGFALAVLGWDNGAHLHSHQVGVLEECRGQGVGLAIKLHQRALSLDHGVSEIRWTYDPLLMANARFNLVRLGAQIIDFVPNCYGVRNDNFNLDDVTDRVKVSWDISRPVGGCELSRKVGEVIEIPSDYLALKNADPIQASEWRGRVGSQFASALLVGRQVLGLCHDGYVIGTP